MSDDIQRQHTEKHSMSGKRRIKLAFTSPNVCWMWRLDELGSTETEREQTRRLLRSLGGGPAPKTTPVSGQDDKSSEQAPD